MGGGEGNRNTEIKVLLFIFYMDENLLTDQLFSKKIKFELMRGNKEVQSCSLTPNTHQLNTALWSLR